MGDPILASVFKNIIDSFTANARNIEKKIEKLKKELQTKEKEIQDLVFKLKHKMEEMEMEGEAGAEKLGEWAVKHIEDLGKRISDIKKELEDLKNKLDSIYKQIGIYAVQYFKYVD